MSYTKGPLRVSGPSQGKDLNDDSGDYAIIESGGIIIGEAFHCIGENAWRDAEANARLWAKAPDLLAALSPFAALYNEHFDDLDDDVPLYQHGYALITVGDVRRAKAALAGARGEESKS